MLIPRTIKDTRVAAATILFLFFISICSFQKTTVSEWYTIVDPKFTELSRTRGWGKTKSRLAQNFAINKKSTILIQSMDPADILAT